MNSSSSTASNGRRSLLLAVQLTLGFALLVVVLVLLVLWRDGRFLTGTARRVAAVLREVKKDERNTSGPGGFIQRLSYSLPSPLDDLIDRIFPSNWKGEYEFVDELAGLGTNAVPFLVHAVEFESSVAARRVSANALGELNATTATPVLARLLRADADPQVRLAMATALRSFRDTNTVPQLMEGLGKDSDANVRAWCAAALGDMAVMASAPLILNDLETVKELEDTQMLISALGQLRYQPAVAELIKHLQPAPPNTDNLSYGSGNYTSYAEQQVRSEAAKALAAIGGEVAKEALIRQLAVESDELVGEALCDSLGVLGGPEAVAVLRAQLGRQSGFRRQAAAALGQLGDASAVPDLIPLLKDMNDDVRVAAARALGLLGGSAALDALRIALAGESNDQVLAATCVALVFLGDDSDGQRVIAAFGRMKESRDAVVWVLGHLGATNVLPLLTSQLANTTDERCRFAAAYELALLGTGEARQALRANLDDHDENARHAKACSLLMLGDDAALGTVRKSFRSKSEWQRFGAVLAVDRSGLSKRAGLLADGQQDANGSIRRYAISASEGAGLAALLELLASGDSVYRQYAARALVFYRDTNAIPALKLASRDPDHQVREAVLLTLRHLERQSLPAPRDN